MTNFFVTNLCILTSITVFLINQQQAMHLSCDKIMKLHDGAMKITFVFFTNSFLREKNFGVKNVL